MTRVTAADLLDVHNVTSAIPKRKTYANKTKNWLPVQMQMWVLTHTLFFKNVDFFIFWDIFVRFRSILVIFGGNVLQEIWNKHRCTAHHISCHYVRIVLCKIWH